MIMAHKFARFFRAIKTSEKGSVIILTALAGLVLIMVTGVAIDVGRGQLVESKLSSSLDAAGLAAGSTVNTTNLTTDATKYMNANFQNYLKSQITALNVSVNSNNTVITLSATASVPTTFMGIFGYNTMTASASSEITRAVTGLELVMVLDNTGSMTQTINGIAKIDALKSAATSLVNILFGGNNTTGKLWIGLVPFAQAVNIGPTRTAWMNTAYTASKNWGTTSWMGCVDARSGGLDVTDDLPATQLFNAYYWPKDTNNSSWTGTLGTSKGPNKNCSEQVIPMTANQTTIINGINSMQAVGNTHINLGTVWGWRMLSPRWRGLWGGEMDTAGLPLDYNAPKMIKAAIIMTDGTNTMSNSVHTAYWYLSNGKLGTTNQTAAVSQLDSRFLQVCQAMKTNNIVIYTIGFGNPGGNAASILTSCATQPSYYFDSPTPTELQAAFSAIGDSLSSLRVSK
jgi:Flp pilus assembly protein TadG